MTGIIWGQKTPAILLLGLAVLVSACASTRVDRIEDLPPELRMMVATSIFESSNRPSRSGTYSIIESRLGGERADDLVPYKAQLNSVVHQVMSENRYTLRPSGSTDIVMAYAVAANEPLRPGDLASPNEGSALNAGSSEDPYGQGSMVVHFYDGATGKIMWRGSIQVKLALDANVSEEVRNERSVHIVRKLLSNFFPGRTIG